MTRFLFLNIRNALAPLAVSTAFLAALPQIPAAEGGAPPPPPSPQEPRINLDISLGQTKIGGQKQTATMARIVEVLQTQAPDVDFVLSPGVAEIVVSNLTLRSADLRGAIEAIGFATGNKVRIGMLGNKGRIYSLVPGPAAKPEKTIEVYNLGPILDPLGPRDSAAVKRHVDDISTLVVKTISDYEERTRQQHGPPLVNFHPETGLLVIIAHPEQIEIAGKIVQALNLGRSNSPAPPQRPAETPKASSGPPKTF